MKYFFLIFVSILLVIPSLCLVGAKEDFVKLEGVERDVKPVAWNWADWLSRNFQKKNEEFFSKRFFLRKTYFKTKCQIYEWINLGLFHACGGIYGGGALYSRLYLAFHLKQDPLGDCKDSPAVKALQRLSKACRSSGIDFMLVFAPDKVQLCDDRPAWMRFMGPLTRMDVQKQFVSIMHDAHVPAFNMLDYLPGEEEREADYFPKGGIHWNAKLAALAVEHVFLQFNAQSDRYRINPCVGMSPCVKARYFDDDLAKLLNLWYNPYLAISNHVPVFANREFKPNSGSVLVFGDSFTWEMSRVMQDGGYFLPHRIVNCDNREVRKDELENLCTDLRACIVVWMPVNAWNVLKNGWNASRINFICDYIEKKRKNVAVR